MNTFSPNTELPVYRQLSRFLSVLEGKKSATEPLLRKASRPDLLVSHLEKELPVAPSPVIFRRLGRHTQLILQFS